MPTGPTPDIVVNLETAARWLAGEHPTDHDIRMAEAYIAFTQVQALGVIANELVAIRAQLRIRRT